MWKELSWPVWRRYQAVWHLPGRTEVNHEYLYCVSHRANFTAKPTAFDVFVLAVSECMLTTTFGPVPLCECCSFCGYSFHLCCLLPVSVT